MKIAHILWAPKIGGAELFALRLARHQVPDNDVSVIYLGAASGQVEGIWSEALNVVPLGFRSGFDPVGLFRLARHLRAAKYDVIHQHQSPAALPFVRLGAANALIVKHEHGRASVTTRSRRQRYAGFLVKGLVDVYIANSDYTARQVVASEGVHPDKIEVVRGGVDLHAFQQGAVAGALRSELGLEQEPIVLFLGRLVWEKGIDDFLAVAALIGERFPEARFVMVGDGPLRQSVEADIKRLGLSEVAVMLGSRQDVPNIMRDSDVFLMTSRQEAQGLTVLEAMASGLPVVSFDAGGIPEVVSDAGIVVKERDVKEMASSVARLIQERDLRQQLVERSLSHVEGYSYREVSRKVLEIYRERCGA